MPDVPSWTSDSTSVRRYVWDVLNFLEEQGIQGYTEECSHLPALLFVHALDGTYFKPQECAEQGRLPLRNSLLGHPNASIEP